MHNVIGIILLFLVGSAQADVISTISDWDGSSSVAPFGEAETATYGQTFSLSTTANMNSFTFYLNDALDPEVIDFQAYVFSWDDSLNKIAGSSLFASSAMSTTNNGGADGFEEFAINTGGITLSAGQYVAFFTASNLFDGDSGTGKMGFTNADAYTGGNLVYMNNGSDFAALSSSSWSEWADESDLAFTVTTTAVPIPAAVWLMFSALAVLGWRGRNSAASTAGVEDTEKPAAA
ncbi:MAG: PEP-CTERM sorting domain-containing protein [Gammaproteobacteria bacterium]|nr:MAG: PEP-CTERM sorting domain-containing protein [Gammaproteobacteria bacterium]